MHGLEMIPGNRFVPATLAIDTGDTVRVHNGDRIDHDFTDRRTFNSRNMEPDAVFSHRFTSSGRYDYVCTYHSGMTGTITVS